MSDGSDGGVVGRAEPLNRLGEVVTSSANGRCSAVLVSGEAGIGKTSLIRAAIDAATADSAPGSTVVGWGTCWHGEGAPGFWPWMQAFDEVAKATGIDVASAAAGHDAGLLSLVIRELGSPESVVGDPDRHRLLLLDAAAGWLETLAADRHVVVVLDDLQWADSSTFDLIDYVIATPRAAQLLVIGAFRHDEARSSTPRTAGNDRLPCRRRSSRRLDGRWRRGADSSDPRPAGVACTRRRPAPANRRTPPLRR